MDRLFLPVNCKCHQIQFIQSDVQRFKGTGKSRWGKVRCCYQQQFQNVIWYENGCHRTARLWIGCSRGHNNRRSNAAQDFKQVPQNSHRIMTELTQYPFHTNVVHAAVLQIYLSEEGCGCLTKGFVLITNNAVPSQSSQFPAVLEPHKSAVWTASVWKGNQRSNQNSTNSRPLTCCRALRVADSGPVIATLLALGSSGFPCSAAAETICAEDMAAMLWTTHSLVPWSYQPPAHA